MKPHSGCEVSIKFSLTLGDGTLVDETKGDETLDFTLGDGTLFPAMEELLEELEEGEKSNFIVGPMDAFGMPDEENVHELPQSDFADKSVLKVDNIIEFNTPSGESVAGQIIEVGTETVKVDFNHPLAGHTLMFTVELLSVNCP
jgi:FKBP-type peptidyl-prolyl cis-trans isomerase SlpA